MNKHNDELAALALKDAAATGLALVVFFIAAAASFLTTDGSALNLICTVVAMTAPVCALITLGCTINGLVKLNANAWRIK